MAQAGQLTRSPAPRHTPLLVHASTSLRARHKLPVGVEAPRSCRTLAASGAFPATDRATEAKFELLDLVTGTSRGSGAGAWTRGLIEEAQVNLEATDSGDVDWSLLPGLWRLVYTTAADVRPLTAEVPLSPLHVNGIYQRFSSPEAGIVQNVIDFSSPLGLQAARFVVDARYTVSSGRRIALVFEAANLRNVRISSGLESLIAPALLPRGWLQQQLLLALRQLDISVPLPGQQGRRRVTSQGEYIFTHLSDDMLVGRALQGTFIFVRDFDEEMAG